MVIQVLVCEDVLRMSMGVVHRNFKYSYLCPSSVEKVSITHSRSMARIVWEASLALRIVDAQ
jgi:hypothetical protein